MIKRMSSGHAAGGAGLAFFEPKYLTSPMIPRIRASKAQTPKAAKAPKPLPSINIAAEESIPDTLRVCPSATPVALT